MSEPLNIELISTFTCSRCVKAQNDLQNMIEELNSDNINYSEINVLEHLDYVVQLGVLTTPAIAISGELVFRTMPSKNQFINSLKKFLSKD